MHTPINACSSRIENLTRGDTVARMLRLSAALDCDLEPGRVKQAVERLVRLGDGLPPGGYSTWSPRPTDSEIGERTPSPPPFPMMGEYRLDRELGRGGMGVVYEAIDTNSERKAAVKMLLPSAAAKTTNAASSVKGRCWRR